MTDEEQQELVIVTGMSGAGRSTASNALEDLDWYVVDNLPPQMLRPMVDLVARAGASLPRLAAVVDIRGGRLFEDLQQVLADLRALDTPVRMLFLDATDETLVKRFEQVRRPHPLQGDGTLLDGITEERRRMSEIREASDVVIDTSNLNIHQLVTQITERFREPNRPGLAVTVMSFGFKYGLPTDADMVADMRFLPNPFWVPELRGGTGRDPAVSEYVLSQPGAQEFVKNYRDALLLVFSGYQRENKRHATIAIGCTGGRHRSVAVAERIAELFRAVQGVAVSVKHRDLGRE